MQFRLFYLVAGLLAVNLIYQNCSNESDVNFNSFKKSSISSVTNHQGNGDSFDGKPQPGDYIRTFPNTNCVNNNVLVQSVLTADANAATIDVDNCEPTDFPIDYNNPALSVKKYNPDFIAYQSGIFENSTSVVANEFNETFCRYQKDNLGIDVVIKNNKNTNRREGVIYLGHIVNNNEIYAEKSPRLAVEMTQNNNQTSYTGIAAIELSVNDVSGNGIVYRGTLMTTVNEQTYQVSLDCLRMHARPVLSLSPMGLLGYWKLDEPNAAEGSVIAALSGPNGILNTFDALTKSIVGRIGGGLNFDDTNDSVNVVSPIGSFGVQSELSLMGWFNRNGSGTDDIIISKRADRIAVPGFVGYEVHINNGNNRLMFIIDDGVNVYSLQSNSAFLTPGWNHFAVVYDRQAANGCRVFINGVDDTGLATADPTLLGPVNNNLDLVFGAMSSTGYNFDGGLDDLSVWNRKLTAEEVRIVFQRNQPLFP